MRADASQPQMEALTVPSLQTETWGSLPGGRVVRRFTLRSLSGVQVELAEYGARLLRVQTQDRAGKLGDTVLGHDTLEPYLNRNQAPYFGALIGRYANRIAAGTFRLSGTSFQLGINNAPNHLHGGEGGFDAQWWEGAPFEQAGSRGVLFRRVSPDGEEGYPGTLAVSARYTLTDEGTLSLAVEATTTQATPINITNHAYWNLASGGAGTVLDHQLTLAADHFLPIDANLIPLGPEAEVSGTPFDFREPKRLGSDLREPESDEQLRRAGGYDHHFVLPPQPEGGQGPTSQQPASQQPASQQPTEAGLRWAATLADPESGRQMQVWTTEPGLQVYSGNVLDGQIEGRGGVRYQRRSAVCLETQHAPDSPNHPAYPSVILRLGEKFRTLTEWRFGLMEF